MDGDAAKEPKTLAEWLQRRMTEGRKISMTYRQVAEYAKIAPMTVKRILDGEKVKADTVLKLSEWSQESFEKLLELTGRQKSIEAPVEVPPGELPPQVRETLDALGRNPFIRPVTKELLEEIVRDEYEKWSAGH